LLKNSFLGHEAGDTVLKKVSLVLQGATRVSDIACRHGGEEFAILVPGVGLEAIQVRAEQLRAEVIDIHVRHKGETLGCVTISCGVAVFPDHGADLVELMLAADLALYRAKGEGRNRVVVAEVTTASQPETAAQKAVS